MGAVRGSRPGERGGGAVVEGARRAEKARRERGSGDRAQREEEEEEGAARRRRQEGGREEGRGVGRERAGGGARANVQPSQRLAKRHPMPRLPAGGRLLLLGAASLAACLADVHPDEGVLGADRSVPSEIEEQPHQRRRVAQLRARLARLGARGRAGGGGHGLRGRVLLLDRRLVHEGRSLWVTDGPPRILDIGYVTQCLSEESCAFPHPVNSRSASR